ncbi:unnamed protein product [Protopolystoma xenopodis]|uniref:Uncharacterized protein n=1 Tax=Protopolystoma xenopodis TaxID=117903 RepID=A0A3S5A6M5_9PLAT|nr:unnamed protein product [Protopolystoma xenopodis]
MSFPIHLIFPVYNFLYQTPITTQNSQTHLHLQIDHPVSPGSRGLRHFLTRITDELRQKHREEIFRVSLADLRRVADNLSESRFRGRDESNFCRVVFGPQQSNEWKLDPKQEADWQTVSMFS